MSFATSQLVADRLGWMVLVALIVLFSIVAYYHNQVKNSIVKHRIWSKIKSTQAARMKLDWNLIPPTPPVSPQPEHPFEIDLDIIGLHSLHQLMDVAISREGSQRLKDWLLDTTPAPQLISQRQVLVQELSPLILFRDKLLLYSAITSKDSNERWEGKSLLDWLQRHTPSPSLRSILIVLGLLAVANIVIFTLTSLSLIPKFWHISYLIYFGSRAPLR